MVEREININIKATNLKETRVEMEKLGRATRAAIREVQTLSKSIGEMKGLTINNYFYGKGKSGSNSNTPQEPPSPPNQSQKQPSPTTTTSNVSQSSSQQDRNIAREKELLRKEAERQGKVVSKPPEETPAPDTTQQQKQPQGKVGRPTGVEIKQKPYKKPPPTKPSTWADDEMKKSVAEFKSRTPEYLMDWQRKQDLLGLEHNRVMAEKAESERRNALRSTRSESLTKDLPDRILGTPSDVYELPRQAQTSGGGFIRNKLRPDQETTAWDESSPLWRYYRDMTARHRPLLRYGPFTGDILGKEGRDAFRNLYPKITRPATDDFGALRKDSSIETAIERRIRARAEFARKARIDAGEGITYVKDIDKKHLEGKKELLEKINSTDLSNTILDANDLQGGTDLAGVLLADAAEKPSTPTGTIQDVKKQFRPSKKTQVLKSKDKIDLGMAGLSPSNKILNGLTSSKLQNLLQKLLIDRGIQSVYEGRLSRPMPLSAQDILHMWTSIDYNRVASVLKGRNKVQDERMSEGISELDKYIEDSIINLSGHNLYRGIRADVGKSILRSKKSVGDTLREPTYQSWTLNPQTAMFHTGKSQFGDPSQYGDKSYHLGQKRVMLEYKPKDKSSALFVGGAESEVLFPRNMEWIITKVRDQVIRYIIKEGKTPLYKEDTARIYTVAPSNKKKQDLGMAGFNPTDINYKSILKNLRDISIRSLKEEFAIITEAGQSRTDLLDVSKSEMGLTFNDDIKKQVDTFKQVQMRAVAHTHTHEGSFGPEDLAYFQKWAKTLGNSFDAILSTPTRGMRLTIPAGGLPSSMLGEFTKAVNKISNKLLEDNPLKSKPEIQRSLEFQSQVEGVLGNLAKKYNLTYDQVNLPQVSPDDIMKDFNVEQFQMPSILGKTQASHDALAAFETKLRERFGQTEGRDNAVLATRWIKDIDEIQSLVRIRVPRAKIPEMEAELGQLYKDIIDEYEINTGSSTGDSVEWMRGQPYTTPPKKRKSKSLFGSKGTSAYGTSVGKRVPTILDFLESPRDITSLGREDRDTRMDHLYGRMLWHEGAIEGMWTPEQPKIPGAKQVQKFSKVDSRLVDETKSVSDNIGKSIEQLVKKGGTLSHLGWQFASVAMSSMGVYFSISGIVMMIERGLGAIFNPLRDVQSLIQSIALSKAFTPELGLEGFLSSKDMLGPDYMNKIIEAWKRFTGIMSTVTGMLGGFAAKVILDPEVYGHIKNIIALFQEFLLDPSTFKLVKEIFAALDKAMPSLISSIKMIGRLIKDWILPFAPVLAFAWALSLVIQPLVSIISFGINISKIFGEVAIGIMRVAGLLQGAAGIQAGATSIKPMIGAMTAKSAIVPRIVSASSMGISAGQGLGMAGVTGGAEAGLLTRLGGFLGIGGGAATEVGAGTALSGGGVAAMMSNPYTLIALAAIVAIGAAWSTNLWGIRDTTVEFFSNMSQLFGGFFKALAKDAGRIAADVAGIFKNVGTEIDNATGIGKSFSIDMKMFTLELYAGAYSIVTFSHKVADFVEMITGGRIQLHLPKRDTSDLDLAGKLLDQQINNYKNKLGIPTTGSTSGKASTSALDNWQSISLDAFKDTLNQNVQQTDLQTSINTNIANLPEDIKKQLTGTSGRGGPLNTGGQLRPEDMHSVLLKNGKITALDTTFMGSGGIKMPGSGTITGGSDIYDAYKNNTGWKGVPYAWSGYKPQHYFENVPERTLGLTSLGAFMGSPLGIGGVAIGSLLGNIFGTLMGRAKGGPLKAGQKAIVGEEGPEMIIPTNDVEVVPHNKLRYLAEGTTGGWDALSSGNLISMRTFDIMGNNIRDTKRVNETGNNLAKSSLDVLVELLSVVKHSQTGKGGTAGGGSGSYGSYGTPGAGGTRLNTGGNPKITGAIPPVITGGSTITGGAADVGAGSGGGAGGGINPETGLSDTTIPVGANLIKNDKGEWAIAGVDEEAGPAPQWLIDFNKRQQEQRTSDRQAVIDYQNYIAAGGTPVPFKNNQELIDWDNITGYTFSQGGQTGGGTGTGTGTGTTTGTPADFTKGGGMTGGSGMSYSQYYLDQMAIEEGRETAAIQGGYTLIDDSLSYQGHKLFVWGNAEAGLRITGENTPYATGMGGNAANLVYQAAKSGGYVDFTYSRLFRSPTELLDWYNMKGESQQSINTMLADAGWVIPVGYKYKGKTGGNVEGGLNIKTTATAADILSKGKIIGASTVDPGTVWYSYDGNYFGIKDNKITSSTSVIPASIVQYDSAAVGGKVVQSGLANVHAGEIITPIEKILPMLQPSAPSSNRGGVTIGEINITIQGNATNEVTDKMIMKIKRELYGYGV